MRAQFWNSQIQNNRVKVCLASVTPNLCFAKSIPFFHATKQTHILWNTNIMQTILAENQLCINKLVLNSTLVPQPSLYRDIITPKCRWCQPYTTRCSCALLWQIFFHWSIGKNPTPHWMIQMDVSPKFGTHIIPYENLDWFWHTQFEQCLHMLHLPMTPNQLFNLQINIDFPSIF